MFHLRTPILRLRYIFRILQSNITLAYKWEIAIDVAVISLWGNAAIWCLYWHIWNIWFKLGNGVFDSKCPFRYWMLLFCYYRNRFSSSRWGLVHVAGVGIIVWRSSANERRRYVVTSALLGWAHTHNDPCLLVHPPPPWCRINVSTNWVITAACNGVSPICRLAIT